MRYMLALVLVLAACDSPVSNDVLFEGVTDASPYRVGDIPSGVQPTCEIGGVVVPITSRFVDAPPVPPVGSPWCLMRYTESTRTLYVEEAPIGSRYTVRR